jgi:hypothetical protein
MATTEVANLEAAFERITVTDENDDQHAVPTNYLKKKVCKVVGCVLIGV